MGWGDKEKDIISHTLHRGSVTDLTAYIILASKRAKELMALGIEDPTPNLTVIEILKREAKENSKRKSILLSPL